MNVHDTSTRRIRVASVYGPSPWNRQWLALQDRFLRSRSNGADIEFGVFLNGTELDLAGTQATVIDASDRNLGHGAALQEVLAHFRGARDRADGYLLLDSDCFPIHPDWARALPALMSRLGKSFAAPVRFENLEAYPHPCALYVDGMALDDPRLRFDATAETENLLGAPVRDVGAGLLPIQSELLPLLRSNVRNLHPVAAAVYNHFFYHHGAGSRGFAFRAIDRHGYYDHWRSEGNQADADALREALFADPEGFIGAFLKGDIPQGYGSFAQTVFVFHTGRVKRQTKNTFHFVAGKHIVLIFRPKSQRPLHRLHDTSRKQDRSDQAAHRYGAI